MQDHPAIAIGTESPNPASYLIWDDQRDGATNSNIYFSRRDPVTGAWSANVKVNTDTGTRNQANPAISTDSSNAYAVWDDFRDGTNNQNIYYAKRSAGTGTWSTPNLKVNDGTGNTNERNPRIAGTAAGAQTAVWVDLRRSAGAAANLVPDHLERNVHRAASVYTPRFAVLINPADPGRALRMRAGGGGARALQ